MNICIRNDAFWTQVENTRQELAILRLCAICFRFFPLHLRFTFPSLCPDFAWFWANNASFGGENDPIWVKTIRFSWKRSDFREKTADFWVGNGRQAPVSLHDVRPLAGAFLCAPFTRGLFLDCLCAVLYCFYTALMLFLCWNDEFCWILLGRPAHLHSHGLCPGDLARWMFY